MNEEIIEKLFLRYQQKGFLTNDEILIEMIEKNVSILQTERICSELLSRGVFICDEKPKSDKSSEVQTETEYDAARIDYEKLYAKIIKKEPSLKFLVDYVRKIKPAQRCEVKKLYPQIKSGNNFARNRLFEMNMRSVLRIAYQKATEFNLSLADTVQNGMIGLHVAIDKFDLAKHDNFSGYSSCYISNFINRNKSINESLWLIPAHIKDLHEKVYKYICENHEDFFLDYHITDDLISEIQKTFEIKKEIALKNLQLLIPVCDIDEMTIIADNVEDPLMQTVYTSLQEQICSVLDTLPQREQEVLKLHFGLYTETDSDFKKIQSLVKEKIWHGDGIYNYALSLNLDEVAKIYNVTRERIRQIGAKALRRLKHPRRSNGLRDYLGFE